MFDIDGTLIPHSNNCFDGSILKLLTSLSINNKVVLATARPIRGVFSLFPEKYKESFNYISLNGGYSFLDGVEYESSPIAKHNIEFLIKNFNQENLWLYSKDKWYSSNLFSKEYLSESQAVNFKAIPLLYYDFKPKILKAVILSESKNVSKSLSNRGLNITYSNPHYIEINAKGVDKSFHLKTYVHVNDILCSFGNGQNDLPLFKNSTYCVAMVKSDNYLKKAASYITLKPNYSGIIEGLNFLVNKI